MKPRQPRVPVRWGFVLISGAIVFGALGAVAYYCSSAVAGDSELRKGAISFVKRALGH